MSTAPDARPPRLCPHCGAGTPPEASTCWLCQSALPPYEQRPRSEQGVAAPRIAGQVGAPAARGRFEPDFVIWTLASMVAALVMIVVVFDVAVLGGIGYAILTALGCAPVIGALAFMMWLRRPSSAEAGSTRGESREQSTLVRVVGGIAMAVGAMLAVMVLIGLLVLALFVLLFIACIAAEGGHF